MQIFAQLSTPRRALLQVVVAIVLLVSLTTSLFAEQHDPRPQLQSWQCRDYDLFLGRLSTVDLTFECTELETIVLSGQSLEPIEYLQSYSAAFSPTSAIVVLSNALIAELEGEMLRAFSLLDSADRVFFHAMEDRGDQMRSRVYFMFFSAAKASILREYCNAAAGEADCSEIEGHVSTTELTGFSSNFLDQSDPFDVLHCLLRTDAFTAQVIDVLQSRSFTNCLIRAF